MRPYRTIGPVVLSARQAGDKNIEVVIQVEASQAAESPLLSQVYIR